MEIYDAHLHWGDTAPMRKITEVSPLRSQYPCYQTVQLRTMDHCAELLRAHGVVRSVAVPFVFREIDADRENHRMLEIAAEHPGLLDPYALLDEEHPEFIEHHFQDIVGVKEHIVRCESVLTPGRAAIFELVRAHGLTLLLHSQRIRRREYVETLVRSFPGMKIQIAHMGRGVPGDVSLILEIMGAFAPYECVSFDTSTIRDSLVLEQGVNLVGAERVLYGSDFPFYTEETEDIMDQQIQHVLRAGLSDAQRESIFSGNYKTRISRGV